MKAIVETMKKHGDCRAGTDTEIRNPAGTDRRRQETGRRTAEIGAGWSGDCPVKLVRRITGNSSAMHKVTKIRVQSYLKRKVFVYFVYGILL